MNANKISAAQDFSEPSVVSEDVDVLAREFLGIYPMPYVRFWIVVSLLFTSLTGFAEWYAMYHLLSLRFVDAMGNVTGGAGGLATLSGVTLAAYVLMQIIWDIRTIPARVVAGLIYAMIVTLLVNTLAPVETSNLQEFWGNFAGSSPFGGAGASSEAPPWFLAAGLLALACIYSTMGMVFLWAKKYLVRWIDVWRDRMHAHELIAEAAQHSRMQEAADRIAAQVRQFDKPAVRERAIQLALRSGLAAYAGAMEEEITALQDLIVSVKVTRAKQLRMTSMVSSCKRNLSRARSLITLGENS